MNYVIIAIVIVLMAALDALSSEKPEEDIVDQIETMLELEEKQESLTSDTKKPTTSEIVRKIALRKDNEHPIKPFIEDKSIKMNANSEADDNKKLSETEEALSND